MNQTRVIAAMVVITLASCALAGCGGRGKTAHESSAPTVTISHKPVVLNKQAYNRTMKRLGRQLGGSVERLFPLVEAQPGTDVSKESVAKLERTRAVVTHVMVKVANIVPPAAIRAEHQRLVKGISALGVELDKLIQVEEKGTSRPWGLYARFESLRAIAKATAAIEKKGYAIG